MAESADDSQHEIAAVKIVSFDPASSAQLDLADRLIREATALAKLDHPNVLRVYSCRKVVGGLQSCAYMVMEVMNGAELTRLLRPAAPLPIAAALAIAHQIALGVEAAHAVGILHRDLKPGNVFVEGRGDVLGSSNINVKVFDFGVAKLRNSDYTQPNRLNGTLSHMAPEAFAAAGATATSDVYALGITLYQCLASGKLPIVAEENTTLGWAIAHLNFPPTPLPADTDPDVAELVSAMLAKDQRARVQAMTAAAKRIADLMVRLSPTQQSTVPLLSPVPTPVPLPVLSPVPVDIPVPAPEPTAPPGPRARSLTWRADGAVPIAVRDAAPPHDGSAEALQSARTTAQPIVLSTEVSPGPVVGHPGVDQQLAHQPAVTFQMATTPSSLSETRARERATSPHRNRVTPARLALTGFVISVGLGLLAVVIVYAVGSLLNPVALLAPEDGKPTEKPVDRPSTGEPRSEPARKPDEKLAEKPIDGKVIEKPAEKSLVAKPTRKTAEAPDSTEKLTNDAMEDYVHARYPAAMVTARKATVAGGSSKAWRVYGASACYLKRRDDAVKARSRLGDVDRQFLKYVCERNTLAIP